MKKPQRDGSKFDVERFIGGAATATTSDSVPKTRGKLPAAGFIRSSFDLPEDLHERLKIAAVKQRRPMRDLVEEAIVARLQDL